MYEYKANTTAEHWNSLKTKQQLFAEFDKDYTNERMRPYVEAQLGGDPELKEFYTDDEFREMAAKIKKAAVPLLPLLEDILNHLPAKEEHLQRAESVIRKRIEPFTSDGAALYAAVLMLALKTDFTERLAAGFGITKDRAGRRAFQRYLAYKKEDNRKREEFEKTEAFRVQSMELQLGLRTAIEYPTD